MNCKKVMYTDESIVNAQEDATYIGTSVYDSGVVVHRYVKKYNSKEEEEAVMREARERLMMLNRGRG